MGRRIGLMTVLILALASSPAGARLPQIAPAATAPSSLARSATYCNPLPIHAADPEVLRWHGTYYLYATSLTNLGYAVWTSKDLVHWHAHENPAYAKQHTSWGRTSYWAPGVIQKGNRFYMYFSCKGPVAPEQISFRISVAVADNPLGPFVDVKSPLFDIGKATIDAEPFIDAGGRAYLYYSLDQSENVQPDGTRHSWIYVIRLGDDMISTVGDPVFCTKASQPWEGLPKLEDTWNEAPYVIRISGKRTEDSGLRNNNSGPGADLNSLSPEHSILSTIKPETRNADPVYVMFYSARVFVDPLYAVGYATASSPLGPWTKSPDNPILKRRGLVSGPGHCTLAKSPDGTEMFILYHTHIDPDGGDERELNIDRIHITNSPEAGVKIKVDGPTRTPQPMPSGAGTNLQR